MGDQPGAGRPQSFKIKSHSRQRRSAKPYSRPSDRKKGVLESVKDFFSPSWLLDFWKGKSEIVEEENDDADSENDRDEPVDSNRDVPGPSGVFERAGSSGNYTVYAPRLDSSKRTEILGNGGLVASTQRTSQTSQKSGIAALLSIRSREPMNRKALETTSTSFTSVSESSRINEYSTRTRTSQEMIETQSQRESSPQEMSRTSLLLTTEPEPSPILNTMQNQPTSSLFGTSLGPESSSTPIELQTIATPKPSVLSSGRLSRHQHASVFRTKPEFSVAAFGSPLPPRPSSQSRRYSSPYYSGNTTFGGASSQVNKTGKRARISSPGSAESVQPLKRQIRPTPLAATSCAGVASQTAKRILETLEKMSSPLVDAKKIPPSPPSSSPLSFTQTRRRKAPPQTHGKPVGSPRKLQAEFGGPPVQSLSVPRRAAISRIHPNKNTSPSTSHVTSTPLVSAPTTGRTSSTMTAKSFVPTPLPMSLSPMESAKSSSVTGGGGKIKTAKTTSTHYKSQAVDEEDEVVNPLPQIRSSVPLTIPTGAKLPSFAFPTSLSSKTSPQTTSNNGDTQKTFSTLKGKSPDVSSNNFKFSVPQPKNSISNPQPANVPTAKKIEYSFSNPAPVNNSESTTVEPSSSSSFFDKFKPSEGGWECSTCMINNKADVTNCVACSTPKPIQKLLHSNDDLLKKFQPPNGSWSCDTCMLTNKESDVKCIACETPKPSSKQPDKTKTNTLSNKTKDIIVLKQFAPSSDSWECPTCMVNNKAQDLKCVACQEQKPGAKPTDNLLLKQFAPVEGSWTCDTCMIVNKSDNIKCIACETPKPGAPVSTTSSLSSTGGFKVTPSDNKFQNSPFQFGTSDGSNKDDSSSKTVTFGALGSSSTGTNPFKLGSTSTSPFVFGGGAASTSTASEKTFTFGSSSATTTSKPVQFGSTAESSKLTIKFGSSESTSQAKPAIQFGVKEAESTASSAGPSFKFGLSDSATDKDKQPSLQFGSAVKTTNPNPTPFVFGGNSSPAKSSETNGPPKLALQKSPKVSSIAQAAAAGLLKIPSSVDVVDLTGDNSNSEPAKTKKTDDAPPNVNLFAGKGLPSASTIFEATTAPKTDQPTTTTLPSLPFAFGTTAAVTKPSEEPTKSAFAFIPTGTATGISKFGKTTGGDVLKFGETSTLALATTTASSAPAAVPATVPAAGFQFGSAFGASDKSASTTTSLSTPQLNFSAPTAQSNPLSDTSKNTGLSSAPFVFKGVGDGSKSLGSGFVFSGTGDGNKSGGNSTTPSTGFAFGGAGSTSTSGFGFGSGATNTSKPSSDTTLAPFVFGGQGGAPKTGFGFGASNQQPFAFGSSNTSTTTAIPASLVNEESMDADGNNNNNNQAIVPAFGSTVTPSAPTAAPFSFAPAAPANTGFNFASNTQQPSSFKFGENSNSTPSMFGSSSTPAFGSSTGTAPPPAGAVAANTGFNFGSPATNSVASQPGGFSVGTGSSSTAFTAGSGGVAQKRVIKRGIRRSKR